MLTSDMLYVKKRLVVHYFVHHASFQFLFVKRHVQCMKACGMFTGMKACGTISLVKGAKNIMVDTGNPWDKQLIIDGMLLPLPSLHKL